MFTPQSMRYKVMKPNNRAVVYGVPFQTNQLGFRDNAAGLPVREPGEERIVVLGDSYTSGAGVPFESLYTQTLERNLARTYAPPKLKVMNLATGGYNVLQMDFTLSEVGMSLGPAYVVVGILVSQDFDRMGLYEEARAIAFGKSPSKPPWIDSLYLTKAFGVYLQHIYHRVAGALAGETAAAAAAVHDKMDERRINEQALLHIQSTLQQRNIPLLVVLLPECYNFAKQQKAELPVIEFLRLHNINYVDLLPSFISSGQRPGYFGLNIIDRHPNVHYNQIVGTELTRALASTLAARKSTHPAGE
jgi:hypothetical protein